MSQTAVTLAFEQWKAQQAATGEPVLLDEFVFALVPGLDPDLPVDRSETLPPAAQIVYRESVTRKGVVNENAVVHSAVLGADVGDFSFNWIGLTNKASGTLAMIVHAPEQQKLKTKEGQQGNVLTRSFLMEFTGAQTETAINTPAETWQIDFTARMAGMDERQRLENIDLYGAAAFFGDGWLVGKTGNQFFVTKGTGYVAGLRAELTANQNITVTTKPVKVWLDVCWTGGLTRVWAVQSKLTVAANLADYEQNGVQHYVFALASIDASGNITDLRPKGSLDGQQASDALKKHEQSRNHPDATTSGKGFTQLSSATNSDSETLAATSKAVKAVNDNANGRLSLSGGTLSGSLAIAMNAPNISLTSTGDDTRQYIMAKKKDASGSWYVGKANANSESCMLWNYTPGAGIEINAAGDININAKNGRAVNLNAKFDATGEVVSRSANSFRIRYGNYGTFWRNDGLNLYLMLTNSGDQDGSYNSLRPFRVSLANGGVVFENDVNAISGITAGYKQSFAFADQYNTKAAYYQDYSSAGTSEYHPLIKQRARLSGNAWAFSMGTLVAGTALSWRMHMKGSAGQDINHNWDTSGNYNCPGQVVPGQYANFDARYYTQSAANARFIAGIRLGARGQITTDGRMTEAPRGCVITGGNGNEGNQIGYMYYRPLQQLINGAWVTVAYT